MFSYSRTAFAGVSVIQKVFDGLSYRDTKTLMEIEFDPNKSAKNVADRGLPFSMVADFDWTCALVAQDGRKPYGEDRFIALGFIGQRLYVVAYTLRNGRARIISFRKANDREVKQYDEA